MSHERPWLASYPEGVPAQIDPDEFPSIVAVLQSSLEKYRDRPAFANLGKVLTYAEVDRLSRQFASYLLGELKLKKGDRVAIMMPNCLQYPIATFGILRAGLTVVIGSEHQAPDLRSFSIVTATYNDGRGTGAVGVIGPTRMRYSRAINAVDSLARAINRVVRPDA